MTDDHKPDKQAIQAVAPTSDHVPALQERHWLLDDAPTIVENDPALHWLQKVASTAPLEEDQVPAAQLVQIAAPVNEYDPTSQVAHCVDEDAPVIDDDVPAPQAIQDESVNEPKTDDQVPAKHDMHWEAVDAPESEVHVPALHKLHKGAPDADQEPAAQATHCAEDERPDKEE
jgi:hypothetical protein